MGTVVFTALDLAVEEISTIPKMAAAPMMPRFQSAELGVFMPYWMRRFQTLLLAGCQISVKSAAQF